MKTIATITAVCLLALTAPAKDKPEPPQPITAPVLLGCLVLTVTAVSVYVVVKCNSTIPSDTGPVTVVLEKSEDHSHWTPVATNTVVLAGMTPVEAFSEQMRGGAAFYRGRVLK